MALRLHDVRLLVTEYEACFFFYRDTLGFPVTYGSEAGDYASFDARQAAVAIYRRPLMAGVVGTEALPLQAESQDRVALHFQVDDVDQAVQALRASGVTILREPTDRPDWGARTAHFRDPDGTLIEISEAYPPARP